MASNGTRIFVLGGISLDTQVSGIHVFTQVCMFVLSIYLGSLPSLEHRAHQVPESRA